jgi:hypothetical protein
MSENIFALKITKLLDLYKWCLPTEERPEGHMSIAELCARMIQRYTGRDIGDFLPFAAQRPPPASKPVQTKHYSEYTSEYLYLGESGYVNSH